MIFSALLGVVYVVEEEDFDDGLFEEDCEFEDSCEVLDCDDEEPLSKLLSTPLEDASFEDDSPFELLSLTDVEELGALEDEAVIY